MNQRGAIGSFMFEQNQRYFKTLKSHEIPLIYYILYIISYFSVSYFCFCENSSNMPAQTMVILIHAIGLRLSPVFGEDVLPVKSPPRALLFS